MVVRSAREMTQQEVQDAESLGQEIQTDTAVDAALIIEAQNEINARLRASGLQLSLQVPEDDDGNPAREATLDDLKVVDGQGNEIAFDRGLAPFFSQLGAQQRLGTAPQGLAPDEIDTVNVLAESVREIHDSLGDAPQTQRAFANFFIERLGTDLINGLTQAEARGVFTRGEDKMEFVMSPEAENTDFVMALQNVSGTLSDLIESLPENTPRQREAKSLARNTLSFRVSMPGTNEVMQSFVQQIREEPQFVPTKESMDGLISRLETGIPGGQSLSDLRDSLSLVWAQLDNGTASATVEELESLRALSRPRWSHLPRSAASLRRNCPRPPRSPGSGSPEHGRTPCDP